MTESSFELYTIVRDEVETRNRGVLGLGRWSWVLSLVLVVEFTISNLGVT